MLDYLIFLNPAMDLTYYIQVLECEAVFLLHITLSDTQGAQWRCGVSAGAMFVMAGTTQSLPCVLATEVT